MRAMLLDRPGARLRLAEVPVPQPGPGQLLVQIHWLSLDPYMRGRMSEGKSYAKPVEIGDVMTGGTVGKVVESGHKRFKAGDFVVGPLGWQQYAVSDGEPADARDSGEPHDRQ